MKKGEKASAKSEEAKSEEAKSEAKKVSKKAFILATPFRVLAKDVVARGALEGLDFSVEYVHTVRSKKRKKSGAGKKGAAGKKAKSSKKSKSIPVVTFGVPKAVTLTVEGQGGGGGGGQVSLASQMAWPLSEKTSDAFTNLVWTLGMESLKKMMETASQAIGT